jgi:hypothetical protein
MAMGIISQDWPAMPWQEMKGRILAADKDEEEKELGKLKTHMLNKYSTVYSDTINKKPIAGTPMKIHLRDNIQINSQKCYFARAMPVHQQAAATKLEQELEAAGIIRKVDKPTTWTSPGKIRRHRQLCPRLLSASPGRGKQGPHNVHAAVRKMAIPVRTNGAFSDLRRLVQEERLRHGGKRERKKNCGRHSVLRSNNAGTHDKT